MDVKTLHRTSDPWSSLVLAWAMLGALSGCTAVGYWDGPSGRSCKASCRTLAADGKSCVDWASTASDACVGKYTTVFSCCDRAGNEICQLVIPGAKGFGCYCQGVGPYGSFVVPGLACE